MKLTKAQRKGLQWFADHGPTGWLDSSAPSRRMISQLTDMGLLEKIVPPTIGLITYAASPRGRQALMEK